MPAPPCHSLGRHCHALDVTVRVAALEGNEDHDATWMLGHTQRIDFERLFTADDELWAQTRIHVRCRHLRRGPDDQVRCAAHGFTGHLPPPARQPDPRQLGRDRFRIVDGGRLTTRHLAPAAPAAAPSRRALPVRPSANPCATAPCRTADGTRGAACCRDLQLEVRCPPEQETLEALLRNRQAPYLCKVDREQPDDECVTVEVLSACSYLLEDGIYCSLHGRQRPDGRPAKPELCSQWPEKRTGLHPGCAFASRK